MKNLPQKNWKQYYFFVVIMIQTSYIIIFKQVFNSHFSYVPAFTSVSVIHRSIFLPYWSSENEPDPAVTVDAAAMAFVNPLLFLLFNSKWYSFYFRFEHTQRQNVMNVRQNWLFHSIYCQVMTFRVTAQLSTNVKSIGGTKLECIG